MLIYTAMGDSITAGEGASSIAYAYPNRIAANLRAQDVPAASRIIAHPGWTSAQLTDAVFDFDSPILSESCAVSIWIGGDDLIRAGLTLLTGAGASAGAAAVAATIRGYRKHTALLISHIRKYSRARIILCSQYNPFPATAAVTEAIAALNQQTLLLQNSYGCLFADTAAWFDGNQARLIAGYRTGRIQDALTGRSAPVHPNNEGHAVIAEGLTPLIR